MATSSADRTSIRFGDFELDLQLGVLRKNGIRLRCQEQPLQVLATLAERPGELITREELRRRVWPQDTFVDFDHALNTAIKKIRAALNDDADAPRYIETVPRRGYRFVGTLDRPASPPPIGQPLMAPRSQEPTAVAMDAPGWRWMLILTPVAALSILVFVWLLAAWHRSELSSAPEFQRLTFNQPKLGAARFTPDGESVVYSPGNRSRDADIYIERLNTAPSPQSLGIANALLLAVSRQGELAVLDRNGAAADDPRVKLEAGTLAQVPLGGHAPRELQPDVQGADWSPDGRLAIVRKVGRRSRLEFPIGHVLYEGTGWIDSVRFSPAGDAIAFLDHPVMPDDRGSVMLVDLKGQKRTLSGVWESSRGLAWSPHGDEIWFAAARSGVSRKLYAVNLNRQERTILSVAGGLSLRDVSRDGRVLLIRDNERLGILFVGAGETQPRDLSWQDWSLVMDISHDGKQILFAEQGENSGSSYQVGLRPTDGSPPVMLGSGTAQSLSPDGKWALSILPPPDDQIVLLPTGVGTPKYLPRGTVERYEYVGARWFPDSKQIVFVGYEAAKGSRCYAQSIEGSAPHSYTPDGMMACDVSPDGTILAFTENHRALLYDSLTSGKPEKEIQLQPSDIPSGWSAGGKSLYIVDAGQNPASVSILELASGQRRSWKPLVPPPGGANIGTTCAKVLITPDGQAYTYTYISHASDLYVVQGLK
jgi:eukaryotic-like serine/threonine-protein kinase